MKALRLLIAEPQAIVRSGLRCLLREQQDVEVVGDTDSAGRAAELARALKPEVLLVSEKLVAACQTHLTSGRSTIPPPLHAVVLTGESNREQIEALMEQEIGVIVSRDDAPETLVEAIRAAGRGERLWLSPRTAVCLVRRRRKPEALERLSVRERELLALAARGRDNTQIGQALHIAPGTVRNRLSVIYEKLGVQDRAEAIAWAWHHGLVRPEHTDDG